MSPPFLVVVAVVFVALLAWLLRRGTRDETVESRAPVGDEPVDDDDGDDGPDTDEELAISSDGEVFIPDGHSVRVMLLGDPNQLEAHREDIEAGLIALDQEERAQLRSLRGKPGYSLQVGDYTGARTRRGAAGAVPWRLETLGRDGDYGFFLFETEEGARAAMAMIDRYRIVRRPLDEDGTTIPASPGDFEEARRRYEETERALAMDTDLEDEGRP